MPANVTTSAPPIAFDEALVRKYDGFGPRYTSYPTADRFDDRFTAANYVDALASRVVAAPLSLYVHVPFCNTICYYCACNKVITKNHEHSGKYIRYVTQEIEIVGGLVEGTPPVTQLHWGGGTPTFLSHAEMGTLMAALRGQFRFAPDAEISIEVDPRKVDAKTIAYLAELGFNRISVGIQDFDPAVQAAVNRIQSEAETRTVIDAARDNGFVSVNADLIYGLPRQTVAGFAATLDKVIAASPDRIALYSYAHVPHLFKPQRQIEVSELPTPEVKLAILALAIDNAGRRPGTATSAWIISPNPATNWPSRSGSASCTGTSRAIRRVRTATCWHSAFRRSARSGQPTCRTSGRSTSTTHASMRARCRCCAASSSTRTTWSGATSSRN